MRTGPGPLRRQGTRERMPRSPPSPPPPCVFPAPPPPLPAPLPADINRQHEMNSRRVGGKKQKVSEEGSTTEEPTDRAKKRRSTKEEPCQSEQWIIPATKKEWSARLNSDDLFKVSRDKNCRMPSVLVTKSNYEDAGLGLFANEKISKGTKVTECGGEIICFRLPKN